MITFKIFLPILQIDESHNWVIADTIKTNDYTKIDSEFTPNELLNNLIDDNFIDNDINDSFVTYDNNDIIIHSNIENRPTLILRKI